MAAVRGRRTTMPRCEVPPSDSPMKGRRLAAGCCGGLAVLAGCAATPMGYLEGAAGPASPPDRGPGAWVSSGSASGVVAVIAAS